MRIAVNTRMLLKNRMEGIARYIYHTTKEMVLAHPEDEFYFFFDRPYDTSFIFADNVTPILIQPPARHPFLFVIWFEWSLYRATKKYNIDVVYSGDGYMSLRSRVPTVLVTHDLAYIHYPNHIPFFSRLYYRFFFGRFHEKAAKLIAVSNATKLDVIKQYGINPSKIDVAYNDTDGSFYALSENEKIEVRSKYSSGKPYFLYLGAIHPRKNVGNIIKSFEQFKIEHNTDHQLLFVGRRAWKNSNVEKIYKDSKVKNEIHFLGVMDSGREKLVGATEALLYVSIFEGFGVPILEAMDANVPVICSNVSSMPEVAGEASIQVDPYNIDQIANAMLRIVNDKEYTELMLSKVEYQRNKFNWVDSSKIIYNAIKEVVSN